MVLKLTTLLVVLGLTVGLAAQTRVVSSVQSRNGVGLSGCQLDFYYGGQGQVTYRVYTDQGGTFFIDNPHNGDYSVTILQGGRSFQVRVTISGRTISPSPLVVPW